MMDKSIIQRIKRIQRHLQLTPDGVIGPATLTAIEQQLFPAKENAQIDAFSLIVSKRGLKQLVDHEISSEAYYNRRLEKPTFPGGESGVTIGIGYDLGYNSMRQIDKDWRGYIPDLSLEKLLVVAGFKGNTAKQAVSGVRRIKIPLRAAEHVFYKATLPHYAAMTRKAYPGVEKLFSDAQSALLSLVFNRGTRMSGSSRKEMKALQPLVAAQDYSGMAQQIKAMKRLWEGKNLDGLLKRRDEEAKMIAEAERAYRAEELVRI